MSRRTAIAHGIVEFVGDQKVPRAQVFAWFQSLLSFQGIALVPVLGGRWVAVHFRSPLVRGRPIVVPEADLIEWKDPRGDYAPRLVALAKLARRLSSDRTARLDRFEKLLANSTTETAARYFTARIEAELTGGRRAGGK